MQPTATSRAYRPDIDGLRAVAVLSVFFYHLNLPGFAGGFVGVDVFFVISGYLISRLLFDEYDRTGTIDFGAFYLRRVRRIIPALLVTLAVTTLGAVVWLSPTLLIAYAHSLVATLVSVSNVFFAGQSGYFDGDATLKPLLHTWSLGVEEQFYLVWPLAALLLSRWSKHRAVLLVLIIIVTTALASVVVTTDPTTAFYQMPFRIGEFALGALLCVRPFPTQAPRWLASVLFAGGLAAIIATVFWYSDRTVFPGVTALLPCLGAAACIWTGQSAGAFTRVLTNRVMVQIGLLSYVLYLVHWPLIVYAPFVRDFRPATGLDQLAIIACAFVLAWVIHRTVETPLRSQHYPIVGFVRITGGLAVSLGTVALALWLAAGWQARPWVNSGSLSAADIAAGQNARFQINAIMCERRALDCSPPTDGKPRVFIEHPPAAEQSVLIIGDSHAVDALNALFPVLPEYQFYLSQLGACPPRRDIATVVGKRFANLEQCLLLTEKRFDAAYLREFDVIAINVLYVRYGPAELSEYLDFLQDNGITNVIVFGDFVTLTRDMGDIINQYGFSPAAIEQFRSPQPSLDAQLASLVAARGFLYVSKYATFCPADHCAWYSADRIPFTYDKSHLSFAYASRLALPYRSAIREFVGATP